MHYLENDHFASTLLIVLLLHGFVIFGITFHASQNRAAIMPAIDVVLIDESITSQQVDDASYLAARSVRGSGTTTEQVPLRSQRSTQDPYDQEGSLVQTDSLLSISESNPVNNAVSTFADSNDQLPPESEQNLTAEERRQMQSGIASIDPIAEQQGRVQAHSERPDELFVSVDTRESDIANYLANWKRKVENLGTLNFPGVARSSRQRNPILEVAIKSDGNLGEALIRRSSGNPRLDQAAIKILRMASPFDPFPEELKEDYKVLRFVYEWQFVGS